MYIVTNPNWDTAELLVFGDSATKALAILLNSLFRSMSYQEVFFSESSNKKFSCILGT